MIRELTAEIMPFSYEEMDRTRSMIGSYSWSIEGQTTMSSLTAFNFFYQTKQTDSMLPRVCLPLDRSQKTSKYGGNNSGVLICTSGADIFVIQNIHKVLRFSTCILHWWNIALHHFFYTHGPTYTQKIVLLTSHDVYQDIQSSAVRTLDY